MTAEGLYHTKYKIIMVTNLEFLQALFAEDAPFVHVTDFHFDPDAIPAEEAKRVWGGNWFKDYPMGAGTNQYFTISIFNPDETTSYRRRTKALFLRTRVIVLDDVKEKLPMSEVAKLPQPAWVLETSAGSEQWGYILNEPCHDRHRVENLLDGLVANGLAPTGKDPGMKGVTRYVRLPEGYNTKAKRMINGKPFGCKILEWHPERKVTLEHLAQPFAVDLDATRQEGRVDGAAVVEDHPLLKIPNILKIKHQISAGRYEVTCPWVEEHTGAIDNGAAFFTNKDGSIGYKCHHGNCESKTAKNLLTYIEEKSPGFGKVLKQWQTLRSFEDVDKPTPPSFMDPAPSFMDAATPVAAPAALSVEDVLDKLSNLQHTSDEARTMAKNVLKLANSFDALERQHIYDRVCDHMHWTKPAFKSIITSLRKDWKTEGSDVKSFMRNNTFVKEQNRFYDQHTKMFLTPDAFQNSYAHEDAEARKTALTGGVQKVDKLTFEPKKPLTFEENGIVYGNTWSASDEVKGKKGCIQRWLDHWKVLGFSEAEIDHCIKWMAYTIQHPEVKINHIVLLAGAEGIGKDWLFLPLTRALREYARVIDGSELLTDFNDYLLSIKFMLVNETELGDHHKALEVSNKLKPIGAAPPDKMRINIKNISPLEIKNIVNVAMTSNSRAPIKLDKGKVSRRFFPLWSDLSTRDPVTLDTLPEWSEYWEDRWDWLDNQAGDEAVIYYLRNLDVSMFKPGEPPKITGFMREIMDSSKSNAQRTIEDLMKLEVGAFASDIVSASDIADTIKALALDPEFKDAFHSDTNWFSPTRVGMVFQHMPGVIKVRAAKGPCDYKPWVIRNHSKYMGLSAGDMYDAYADQMYRCRGTTSVLKGAVIQLQKKVI